MDQHYGSGFSNLDNIRSSSLGTPFDHLQIKLEEKRLELQGLQRLEQLSRILVSSLEELREKLNHTADAAEAFTAVATNWNSILRAIVLASAGVRENCKSKDDQKEGSDEQGQLPDTLVRIKVDGLHQH